MAEHATKGVNMKREYINLKVKEKAPPTYPGKRFSDVVKIGDTYNIDLTENDLDWQYHYDLSRAIKRTINRDFGDSFLMKTGEWHIGYHQEGIIFAEFNVSRRSYEPGDYNRDVLVKVSYAHQFLCDDISSIDSVNLRPGLVVFERIA